MKQRYLLTQDVEDIGRSGELISVKPGFARNYLLPRQKAVLATKHTLRMQVKLQEERKKKASIDRQEAEEFAKKFDGITLTTTVKVDPEGNMYGAVGSSDLIKLFKEEGIVVDRRQIGLNKSIKQLGIHHMTLKLKEGVVCDYTLHIVGESLQESRG